MDSIISLILPINDLEFYPEGTKFCYIIVNKIERALLTLFGFILYYLGLLESDLPVRRSGIIDDSRFYFSLAATPLSFYWIPLVNLSSDTPGPGLAK